MAAGYIPAPTGAVHTPAPNLGKDAHSLPSWQHRTHTVKSDRVLSRMYAVDPKDDERFWLRACLLRVPGATDHDDLKRKILRTVPEAARQHPRPEQENVGEARVSSTDAGSESFPWRRIGGEVRPSREERP